MSSNTSVLPVWRELTVVPANVYNALTGTSALSVDVTNWNGVPVLTPQVSGVPIVDSNYIAHTSVNPVPSVNVTQWTGTAVMAPQVSGLPQVDVNAWSHSSVAATPAVNVTQWNGGIVIAPNVSGVPVVDSNYIAHLSADYPVKVNSNIKKNTQISSFPFVMTDVNNHKPTASLAVNAFRSIDGAAFATCASSVVEVANGVYYLPVCATDVNGNEIMFRFAATSADDTFVHVVTDP